MEPPPSQTRQDPPRAKGLDPFAESGMEPRPYTSMPLGDRPVGQTARPGCGGGLGYSFPDGQVSTDYRVDTLKIGEAQSEELTGRAGFWSGA